MTAPSTITVEVEFTPGVWTDVSQYVEGFDTDRGRSFELDEIQAGVCNVTFDNTDGRFTPLLSTSPYYPNVVPRKQLRVRAKGALTLTPVFQGRIEKWPVTVDNGTSQVVAPVIDDFNRMAGVSLMPMIHQTMLSVFKPDHYWPMNEGPGATQVANIANSAFPGALLTGKAGGAYTTGGLPLTKVGETGAGGSIALSGNTVSGTGACVQSLTNAGGGVIGHGFSFAMLVNATNWSAGGRELFSLWTDDGRMVLAITMDFNMTVQDWTGNFTHISSTLTNNVPTVFGATLRFVLNDAYVDIYTGGPGGGVITQYLGNIGATFPLNKPVGAVYFGSRIGGRFGNAMAMQSVTIAHAALWLNGVPPAGPSEWPNPWVMLDAAVGDESFAGVKVASILSILFAAGLGSSAYTTQGVADTRLLKWPDWADQDNCLATALAYADEVDGMIVMGEDGTPRLITHDFLSTAASVITFKDSSGTSVEPNLEFDMDFDHVENVVTVDNYLGATQVVRDAASQAAYGDTTADLVSHFVNDQDAVYHGQWRIHQYAQPIMRLSETQVMVSANAVPFDTLTAIGIGSRITIGDLPSQAPFTQGEFVVERIQHVLAIDGLTYDWQTTFDLSPASLWDVWILEDPVKGLLDSTTVLSL